MLRLRYWRIAMTPVWESVEKRRQANKDKADEELRKRKDQLQDSAAWTILAKKRMKERTFRTFKTKAIINIFGPNNIIYLFF